VRDHKDFAVDYAWDWNTPGGVPGNAGTISKDSIARMMDALNPKPEPEAVASEPDEQKPEDSAGPGSEVVAEAPQEPVEDEATAKPEKARDGPRPRRHGGAAPI